MSITNPEMGDVFVSLKKDMAPMVITPQASNMFFVPASLNMEARMTKGSITSFAALSNYLHKHDYYLETNLAEVFESLPEKMRG